MVPNLKHNHRRRRLFGSRVDIIEPSHRVTVVSRNAMLIRNPQASNSNCRAADDVVQCETMLTSTGKDTVDPTDDECRLQCSVCEGHSLRFVAQTPKPSWSSVLTHTDERCPEWYAETEYAEFCTYLEREYGISYEDWDLGTRIESTMSRPRPAPQPRQLYLPGLSPECAYLIESY